MPTPQPPVNLASIDIRGLLGIFFGPAVIAVLLAALVQSLGHWHGRDAVAYVGGPMPLLLGTGVLLYAVFGLMHALHAFGDALFGDRTPLWWQPDIVNEGEENEEGEVLAVRTYAAVAFPCHLDGAVLSGGLSLACWLALTAVA